MKSKVTIPYFIIKLFIRTHPFLVTLYLKGCAQD